MSSSIDYGQKLRQTQQEEKASACILKNWLNAEPAQRLAALQAFVALDFLLDGVPMTRDQREVVDEHIASIAVIMEKTFPSHE